MRSATALDAGQSIFHLCFGGLWIALKKRGGGHDPAVDAISALRNLLCNEGFLQFMGFAAAKSGERRNFRILDGIYRRDARTRGGAVDDDCASSALGEAAAKFWIPETEVITQRIKQRHVAIGVDGMRLPINIELNSRHELPPIYGWLLARPSKPILLLFAAGVKRRPPCAIARR